tara:strand:- start:441 stop:1115 length:675 start_codon:yes stop_codon:yes gene_type:complete
MPAVHKDYITQNYLHAMQYNIFDRWDYLPISAYHSGIRVGEVACCIGHLQCWEAAYHSDFEHAIILEDDCYWEGDFAKEIKDAIEFNKDYKYGVGYLGRIPIELKGEAYRAIPFGGVDEPKLTDKYNLAGFSYNLHAYLINRRSASAILSQSVEGALMTPDEIIPALCGTNPHPFISQRFPKAFDAFALHQEIDKDNIGHGIAWQKYDGSTSRSLLTNSKVYDE